MPLEVEVEVDDALLESVLTDEWRAHYYALHAPEEVAEHLAYNLVQGSSLASLDGFADQPPLAAKILRVVTDDAVELLDDPPRPSRAPARRPRPRSPRARGRRSCG